MPHRRIAILSAHLLQTDHAPPSVPHRPPGPEERPSVAASCCSGSSDGRREPEAEPGGQEGCVFCRIIRGESPAFKLFEDDVCICILDSNPLTYGHSLIIPKLHSPSLDATPPLWSIGVVALISSLGLLSGFMRRTTYSFNLLVNNGSAAGQVIYHTHLHIIPRKAGDQLWPSESCRRKPIELNQQIVNLVNSVRGLVSSQFQNNC